MRFYSNKKARRYLNTHGLHFEMTKDAWKQIQNTGRLLPKKGSKFSQAQLDTYIHEVKPR